MVINRYKNNNTHNCVGINDNGHGNFGILMLLKAPPAPCWPPIYTHTHIYIYIYIET